MKTNGKSLTVAIVGGGLVGSLSACYMARRGHHVDLYEYREDIRRSNSHQYGRTINLTMSARARRALAEVGLEDLFVNEHGIPLEGRMVHKLDGELRAIPYDPRSRQCIYSVERRYLNEVLLTAAEKYPNVNVHFKHKLVEGNLDKGIMKFTINEEKERVLKSADLVIGADGSYSTVRRLLMKQPMFDYSQNYIEHGYFELCIPPTKDRKFAMEPNYLHLWPRGTFMMIALPNQDCTWTVTLFMPFRNFEKLKKKQDLLRFFERYFPDAIPLIGEDRLVKDFFGNKPFPLISVKCRPYHLGSSAIIIGDAAHAMVPFYGQGMNAGFEDCYILNQLMDQYEDDLSQVLPKFTEIRYEDARAICDLAMYNYLEMRELVNKRSFLMRKKLDEYLFRIFPNVWIPLYLSVTFTNMKYRQCEKNKKWQDRVVSSGVFVICVFIFFILSYIVWQTLETTLRPEQEKQIFI